MQFHQIAPSNYLAQIIRKNKVYQGTVFSGHIKYMADIIAISTLGRCWGAGCSQLSPISSQEHSVSAVLVQAQAEPL